MIQFWLSLTISYFSIGLKPPPFLVDIGSSAGQKTFMPFCAALPYRAAVLADETTSSTVVEGFMSASFPVRKTDGPFSNNILQNPGRFSGFQVEPSLGIAYQKGSWSRDECSRKSDAEAITITILFSMKPGWIWDGVRTTDFLWIMV